MSSDPMGGAVVLPSELVAAQQRDKVAGRGGIAGIHPWWGRRTPTLSRLAMYLALTDGHAEDEFLQRLCSGSLDDSDWEAARVDIRDAQWRHFMKYAGGLQSGATVAEGPAKPARPRVLDPFAGGGSIPFEGLRLGCEMYATDINPVTYHVLLAGLVYPQQMGAADGNARGVDGSWKGLMLEVEIILKRLEKELLTRVADLFASFPPGASRGHGTYLWVHLLTCPECGHVYPADTQIPWRHRGSKAVLRYRSESDSYECDQEADNNGPAGHRGVVVCPFCSSSRKWREAFTLSRRGARLVAYISPESREPLLPTAEQRSTHIHSESEQARQRCAELKTSSPLTRGVRQALSSLRLPSLPEGGPEELFSPRQFVVCAELLSAITSTCESLTAQGVGDEHVRAIKTYMAFFCAYVADANSVLCGWDGRTPVPGSFRRLSPSISRTYLEQNPVGLAERWLRKVGPAINTATELTEPATVLLSDAARTDFEDDFFDAIVTDPPYFDRIPYGSLSSFYWTWEAPLLAAPVGRTTGPSDSAVAPRTPGSREVAHEAYVASLEAAMAETHRVLKPGRLLCMILTDKNWDSFHEFVNLAVSQGFELANVQKTPEVPICTMRENVQGPVLHTFLVHFRKPNQEAVKRFEPDADAVKQMAEEGQLVLYRALAEFLISKAGVGEEHVDDLLPGSKGPLLERLQELLGTVGDPADALQTLIGKITLGELAKDLQAQRGPGDQRSPVEVILTHFGFRVVSPSASLPSVTRVIEEARAAVAKIRQSRVKDEVRGAFLNISTAVEGLVWFTVTAWAEKAFGSDRDEALMQTFHVEDPGGNLDLKKPSFGDRVKLFKALPDRIATSMVADELEQKLGRRHVYLPKGKKTKWAEHLFKVVNYRNKVEHNKDNYWTRSGIGKIREDAAQVIGDCQKLLVEMQEEAIPLIGRAVRKTTDMYGRDTYTLNMDNGTVFEFVSTHPIELGRAFVYFGGIVNPIPVDPLLLSADRLGSLP